MQNDFHLVSISQLAQTSHVPRSIRNKMAFFSRQEILAENGDYNVYCIFIDNLDETQLNNMMEVLFST